MVLYRLKCKVAGFGYDWIDPILGYDYTVKIIQFTST